MVVTEHATLTARELSSRAMLVKLTRRTLSVNKKDPLVAQKVLAQHGADAKSGTFTKRVLAKDALKSINNCLNEAYKIHNQMTLPWDDEGRRILSAKNFFEYKKSMNKVESRLAEEVKEFVSHYPEWIEEARLRLNGLFKADDYLTIDEVAEAFKLEIVPEPVPTGSSLHIDIAEEYLNAQREEIERRVQQRFAAAHEELYSRLSEVVTHLHDSIADEKDFKAVTVERVSELCKSIRSLSIPEDHNLFKIADTILEEVTKYHPHDIRDNAKIGKRVRDTLSEQVMEIEHSLFAYFNG